jgi:hypothetical protein
MWKKLMRKNNTVVAEAKTADTTTQYDEKLANVDAAITNLQRRLRNMEDSFTEVEHEHKIFKAEFELHKVKLDNALHTINKVDALVSNSSAKSASKEELLELIEAVGNALSLVKDKMTLPF